MRATAGERLQEMLPKLLLFCRNNCVAMGAALFPAASLAKAFVVRLAKVAAAGLGLFVLA